jgi:hypothetical protein
MRFKIAAVTVAGLVLATVGLADMRTKSIHLVPEIDFDLNAQPIRVVVENNVDLEKMPELVEGLEEFIGLGLDKLGYTLSDSAPMEFRVTIDYADFGTQWKRLLAGGMAGGKGHIEGRVLLRKSGKTVGSFKYSSRLRGGITQGSLKAMAKEVGPPLVLKLDGDERDTELHERPENKKKGE